MSPLYRVKQILPRRVALGILCIALSAACSEVERRHDEQQSIPHLTSDSRHPIPLPPSAGKEHRAVMLQHLETIQVIVNALVEEDYELARGLTELHLGFFMHRQEIASQKAENFPHGYYELAQSHREAAEDLARIIPTKDLKQILPKFNSMLKACVACHLEFKITEPS
jgi:hypothetical protein